MSEVESVAFLGLGVIGRAIAQNIALKAPLASPLIVWNRTAARSAAFTEQLSGSIASGTSETKAKDVVVATTPIDAVRAATLIFTCLSSDEAVEELFHLINDGQAMPLAGKLWVDCTVVQPESSAKMAVMMEKAGCGFVAAPVYGAEPVAQAGDLIMTPAGPGPFLDRLASLTPAFTRAVVPLRDQPVEHANMLKLVSNTLVLAQLNAVAEAHALAETLGLRGEDLHGLIETNFLTGWTFFSKRMIGGDYANPEVAVTSSAQTGVQNLSRLQQQSLNKGVDLRGFGLNLERLRHAADVLKEKADVIAIYGAVREEVGRPFGPAPI